MHHCLPLGPSWEKNYVEMWNFPNFSNFKMVTATLIQLHLREEKTHVFLVFLIKYRHQSICFNASLSYMNSILGEKLC